MKLLVAFTVVALLALAAQRFDMTALRQGLMAANASWLCAAVLAHLLIQPLAALQWRALLPASVSTTWRQLLRLFALTSVANNSANTLVGHATGVAMLTAEPTIGARGALSLLVLDQLCVGIAKLCVLGAAAMLLPLPTWMRNGVITLLIAVAALAVAIVVLRRWPTIPFIGAIRTVNARRMAAAVLCAVAVKAAEAAAIAAVQLAFGIPCTATSVLFVLSATTLATLVPVIPANLGTYEAAVFLALRAVDVPVESAMLAAVVQHACQLFAALAPGAPLLWLPARRVT